MAVSVNSRYFYTLPGTLPHYAGTTGLRISPYTHAHPLTQGRVHPLPGAGDPPICSEVMMDSPPGREVVEQ
jgi:hypothetical protein